MFFLTSTSAPNWASFIELFLSSFLGFGTALLVEAIWDKHKDKQLKEQLSENLKKELEKVVDIANSLDANLVYIAPFSIPVWHGATTSGSILCMDDEKWFSDLLDVFSSIDEANQIESRCFELTVGGDETCVKRNVVAVLTESRRNVLERAKHGISLFEGGFMQ